MGPGFGILFAIAAVLILLLVGSTLLRAAAAMTNKVVGPVVPKDDVIGWDWDADEEDDEDDDEPGSARGKPAIPEPGLGQGMVILFLAAVAELAVGLVVTAVFELDGPFAGGGERVIPHLFGLAVGFLAMVGLLCSMLPARFGPAALTALFFYLILIVIVVLVVGIVAVLVR